MANFPERCYREADRACPLALAFLMARGGLASPEREAWLALSQGEAGAVSGLGARGSSNSAVGFSALLGPVSKKAFGAAFGACSACFAIAPKVDVYLFEAGDLVICAKMQRSVFEWGWARNGAPVESGQAASAEERAQLALGMIRIGCSLALACQSGLEEWADELGPSRAPPYWRDQARRWASEVLALAPILGAESSRVELERVTPPGAPSLGRRL